MAKEKEMEANVKFITFDYDVDYISNDFRGINITFCVKELYLFSFLLHVISILFE